MRILIIDDEPALRMLVRRMLESAGHDVVEAEHGRAGVELYEKQAFDVVVTDIIMPESEGLETVRRLRGIAPGLRIVAISGGGRGAADYLGMASAFGANATLPKPFRREELLACVEGRSSGRSADQPPD
jgi:CheY-like chemotaxis protein